MSDLEQEHQREIEGLLDNIRELTKEFQLQSMVIDSFIPQEFQVSRRFTNIYTYILPNNSILHDSLYERSWL